MIKKIYLFFLLIVGIGISVIAGFFSISGLTTIFKGSELSVLLMGTFLEIAKVNVSVYIHLFWKDIRKALLSYLIIALLILMSITSLGIYGYLSKSFFTSTDTSSISTKVESMNISLEIEKSKVKTARDEIDYLNNIPREDKKSWHVYRVQKLSKDIDEYSKKIDSINEKYITEKVKLNSLESEVGPLKYLAMIIYQDKSQDAIAKSVQIFIIFIVCVFDPLAILTILSAISGFEIIREQEKLSPKQVIIHEEIKVNDQIIKEDIIVKQKDDSIDVEVSIPQLNEENKRTTKKQKKKEENIEEEPIEQIVKENDSIIESKKIVENPIIEEKPIEQIVEENDSAIESKEIVENPIIEEKIEELNVIEETLEKEPLSLITTEISSEQENIDQKILEKFEDKTTRKKKKKEQPKNELDELSINIFDDEEKIKEIVIKERPLIEIDRTQEFEDDIINSVIDDIISESLDKDQKDNIDKMYNQVPMVGGKFNDNS
jgi:hypothetical protein